MPTVKLPNGQKRTFPYNAVGKAQANAFMKMSGGKMKNNPNYGMETVSYTHLTLPTTD